MRHSEMTGVSRIARRFPRPARLTIPVIGFLVITTVILWIHVSRSHSEPPLSGEHSSAAPAARRPEIAAEESVGATAVFRLTEQERRGKQIYTTGTSPTGGTMTAVLGSSNAEIPATALT